MKHDSPTHRAIRMQRMAVGGNAAFSATCAVICLLAREPLGELVGLSSVALAGLGTELLAFAGFLALLATRKDMTRPWIQNAVLVICMLDVLWVVGSALALVQPAPLTSAGRWMVGAIALAVADFAAFQVLGWWRLRRATLGSEPRGSELRASEPAGAMLHRDPARSELSV